MSQEAVRARVSPQPDIMRLDVSASQAVEEREEFAVEAIDLFAGWGGFTLGAQQAGVPVAWSANHWDLAVATHAMNHPQTQHVCQDLRQADWTTLPRYQLLLASPACQGHSPASQPRRRLYHDALRATAFAVIDCADVTEPDAILVENVPAFARWRLFGQWVGMLETLGYQVEQRQVTASWHGVAQRRTRLFLVCTRPGVRVPQLTRTATEPAFGPLLHTPQENVNLSWTPLRTAPDGVRARVQAARRRHGNRFLTQHTTRHPGVGLHEPIRTITTAAAHWNLVDGDRYRALTGRELARGMGFPDDFTWPENATISQVTKGLGNAVCPPVARQLVAAVADAVSGS